MKRAVLLAAFGASNPVSRSGLAHFECLCRARFPAVPIRWAYTSPLLRERLAKQKQKIDSVSKALARLRFENFSSVAIQPLQAIAGREYGDILAAAEEATQNGLDCAVGAPLLGGAAEEVASALLAHIPAERGADEDVIFMGHGAKHPGEAMYLNLNSAIAQLDPRAHIGTMSPVLGLDKIRLSSPTVWLLPLLSSIGQHALRDMAGDGPESWKSRIESAGHVCRPALRAMVDSPQLCAIWIDKLAAAASSLSWPQTT